MKTKFIYSALLIPLCLIISSCSNRSKSSEEDKPFEKSVPINLKLGENYSDLMNDDKWEYDDSFWYMNNLDKVPLPDPQVYVENGTYFIVGTDDASSCKLITCYYTTDFVSYEKTTIYNPLDYSGCWENHSNPTMYAPEMYKVGDKYYLYYSAIENSTGQRRNSVVWADTPLGPYEPIVTGEVDGLHNALFAYDELYSVLDATLFIDDNKDMYMYYSQSINNTQSIFGVKLTSPYQADFSTRKLLVKPGTIDNESSEILLQWESYRTKASPIVEGPFMLKSKGKYYMTYSVNGCWNKYYDVCYAVSDSPLGKFTKPYTKGQLWTNLLMGVPCTNDTNSVVYNQWSGFASGTGHHCFFNIGDQIMIGYHAHLNRNFNSDTSGWVARYFAMDPLYFLEDGTPFVNGPSWSPQPLPEAISGYENIAPKAKVRVENIKNETAINDNYIVDCYNLEQEQGKEVTLGQGYSYIELKLDKKYKIKALSIYSSADYDAAIYDLNYVQFSNGDALGFSQLSANCVNYDKEFIFPVSGFVFDFKQDIEADSVIISFNGDEGMRINEIQVLGI